MSDDTSYLLSLKESEFVELKEACEKIPLNLYESYCAMANGKGGAIYLGIAEGEPLNIIKGVQNAPQKVQQLCNTLTMKNKIMNNIFTSSDIQIIPTKSGDVIKINVQSVPIDQRPVFLYGDPSVSYKRVGDGDKLLDESEIRAMINDSSKVRFDQKPNQFGLEFDDLDQSAVERFVARAKAKRAISSVETMTPQQILSRIGAIALDKETKKPVVTNGGVLFFGTAIGINAICPSLWLDYLEKGNGNERFSFRISNKEIDYEPNIFNFYERVLSRLSEALPSPFHLGEGGINDGKSLVEEIVREALANAVSNLDTASSMGLRIERSGPNLTLCNAGGMLTGLEQALRGGVSEPRNRAIFNFFLAIGITDHGGFGVPAIFDKMKALKMVRPIIEESNQRDKTTLRLCFTQIDANLSQEEQRILVLLSGRPNGISSSTISEELNISRDNARRMLLGLVEKGKVKDNGKSNKGRLYLLADAE